MKNTREYKGEYGRLVVDFENHEILEDSLDREKIWKESGEDYHEQSLIYSEIISALRPEDFSTSRNQNQIWAGRGTDFGFVCFLDDGWVLLVDAEESVFFKNWKDE